MSRKTAILIPAWLVSCLVCLGAGYLLAPETMELRAGTPAEPAGVRIPSAGPVIVTCEKNPNQIYISRAGPNGQILDHLRINTAGGHLVGSFYPGTGHLQEIAVGRDDHSGHDWGLRKDGSVEYATVYSYDAESTTRLGTRKHFDLKGNVTRTEKTAAIVKLRRKR